MSNRFLDAYVLSESSLFVYPYMIVLKTCGTTSELCHNPNSISNSKNIATPALLRCVATLIELGHKLGLEIDWLGYNRKNFSFPSDQMFPHGSFHQEMEYLYSHRNLCERLDGNGYTLGPVTGDHWFVFVADKTKRASWETDTGKTGFSLNFLVCQMPIHLHRLADRVLNLMMFDIDEDVARKFYYDQYEARTGPDETDDEAILRISGEQTKAAGIDELVPGATIDPRAFEPCGYSMNAVLFHSYSTMHITPEEGSSYASFETNQKVKNYIPLISNVVRAFRPKRFVVTLMADEFGLKEMGKNPLFMGSARGATIEVPIAKFKATAAAIGSPTPPAVAPASFCGKKASYKRSNVASIQVEDDVCCFMGNWVLADGGECDGSGQGAETSVMTRPRGYSEAQYS